MRWPLKICFIAIIATPQITLAETYRCDLGHIIDVGHNGKFEDKKAVDDQSDFSEFYLNIDFNTNKGTSSACTKTGCTKWNDLLVAGYKKSEALETIRLVAVGGFELWSLERLFTKSGDFHAATASISGLSTRSRFGACRLTIGPQ